MLQSILIHFETLILSKESPSLIEGVYPLLCELKRKNILLYLMISDHKEEAKKRIATASLTAFFDFVLPEIDANEVISSHFLQTALSSHSLTLGDSLLITHTKAGCISAKDAHIPCLAYPHPNSICEDLFLAPILIESFSSIDYAYLEECYLRFHHKPLVLAKTKRLLLREFQKADMPYLHAIFMENPITDPTLPSKEFEDEEDVLWTFLEQTYSFYGFGIWGIFLKETDELIGCCGIQNQQINGVPSIELCYQLGKKYWHHGYAREACERVIRIAHSKFDIDQLIARIQDKNTASIHLAKILGFRKSETWDQDQHYQLYRLSISEHIAETATLRVTKNIEMHPDTSVYSKRFSYRKK